MNLSTDRRSKRLFLLLCAGCLLAVVIFGIVAARRSAPMSAPHGVDPVSTAHVSPPAKADQLQSEQEPHAPPQSTASQNGAPTGSVFFRANALGPNYGKLATAPIDALDSVRYSESMACDRLYYSGGVGVCLASDRGMFTAYYAIMFDSQMRPGWRITLKGIPSRVRISPTGKLAAITVFVSGHSYTSIDFSTQTLIVEVATGRVLADMEEFLVTRNGERFQSVDFNFWGVTFLNDERGYATLSSKGVTYLVESDFVNKTARVIHEGIECPSLSPDRSRLAFKKRTGAGTWRIAILDLKTLNETPLDETRSVDDQVEWLDNDHVLYALSETETRASASTDVWSLPAKGGSPRLLLKGGYSPAVVTAR